VSDKPDPRALLGVDRLVHEPARFLMLAILSGAEEVEFKFLEETTGLTKGNLSSHASKLEEAGYIEIRKAFRGKTPVTSLRITREGTRAFNAYRRTLSGALGR